MSRHHDVPTATAQANATASRDATHAGLEDAAPTARRTTLTPPAAGGPARVPPVGTTHPEGAASISAFRPVPPDDDIPRYTLAAYVRDRCGGVLAGLACAGGVGCLLLALGAGAQAAALAAGFVAVVLGGAFVGGYLRRASWWREATRYVREAGSLAEYVSLVREPHFLDGRMAHEITSALARIADDELRREREEARAHREYVELWVHEAKTPIAAAKLTLADMHGARAEALRGDLERVEARVEQALFAARAATAASDYLIREVALADACRAAVRRNARGLVGRGVAVEVRVSPETRVLADETWLTFMLAQVVDNAAKYGATRIAFSAREEDPGTPRGRTLLEVRDDGEGIPAADVPRVFERGFTGQVGRAHGSATGMGLYLVAQMCRSLGLGVGLASERGVGTRVTFVFPHDRRREGTRG